MEPAEGHQTLRVVFGRDCVGMFEQFAADDAVAAGLLVPVGVAILSVPSSLFSGHAGAQAVVFAVELAVFALTAPTLVRQWLFLRHVVRHGHAKPAKPNVFLGVFTRLPWRARGPVDQRAAGLLRRRARNHERRNAHGLPAVCRVVLRPGRNVGRHGTNRRPPAVGEGSVARTHRPNPGSGVAEAGLRGDILRVDLLTAVCTGQPRIGNLAAVVVAQHDWRPVGVRQMLVAPSHECDDRTE